MKQIFKNTKSAGGVIVRSIDGKTEILLLGDPQYDDWFLPKGHLEQGETLEEAALREVGEEAGLSKVTIVKLLGIYRRKNEDKKENKTIYYYLMKHTLLDEKPKKTADNKGLMIRWFSIDRLPKIYFEEQYNVITKNIEDIKNIENILDDKKLNLTK